MKNLVTGLLILCFGTVLTACDSSIDAPHFMWEGHLYIATYEPLTKEDLEKEIGVLTEEVNGTAAANSEARDLPEGTVLYKIEDREIVQEGIGGFIGYEVDGEFRIASMWNEPE
ncbi:hypothetical protein [Salisediminibacterium beveridgei]|uniref:DUF4830 domain-containing protein n=1 Tax=Salisediminibacterium beveridgei TaxID=632773 RepID=A0A1D7QXY9_9BACI|nr:hypothetical protein [Salisediminibacterium beveridgei]AOM83873.1 hypothetical protein BBEV_2534 [Salisediminibacterium beveridgei]